ncbi:hypothetical protein PV08_11195 [Exophiala spinifera]|uniref:Uncharacterized protein n=1 Tax=Exophiala spinifera TaxID=91928 RepID=A0A0D2BFT3_9EURO|nr:uncharacterized protein PV08_11195 [Exophiala spinifera]KIW10234.1 hypothetical protein PV08_11195 [Exophiala spinifera]
MGVQLGTSEHPRKYAIRMHEAHAEESTRNRVSCEEMQKDTQPPAIESINEDVCAPLDILSRRIFDRTRVHNYRGRFDPRVHTLEHSLGQFYWSYIGAMKHEVYTHPNWEFECAQLRQVSTKYWCAWDTLTDEMKKQYKANERAVLFEILQIAAVVVSTTNATTSPFMAAALGMHIVGILLDEAAAECDDNTFPVLAIRYTENQFVIMVGDSHQLSPKISTPNQESSFKRELTTPLFTRLIKVGFSVGEIYKQSRIVPDIVNWLARWPTIRSSPPRRKLRMKPANPRYNFAKLSRVVIRSRRPAASISSTILRVDGITRESQYWIEVQSIYTMTTSRMIQELLKIKS